MQCIHTLFTEQFQIYHVLKKINFHNYVPLNVFHLYVTSGELEWFSLNNSGKTRTSKQVSELCTALVTYRTKTLI